MSAVQDLDFLPGFALEGFPNRDSTIYKDLYGLNNVHTILRGTLRFKGFSNTIRTLQYLRLTDSNPHPSLHPNGPDITWVCIYIYMYAKCHYNHRKSHFERLQQIQNLLYLQKF